MSGIASLIQSGLNDTPDPMVSIQVGKHRYMPWESVTITKSCEIMPNSFSLTGSVDFLDGDALADTEPGQACEIYSGDDILITGWIDRRTIDLDARSHRITVTGRGITRNLVDASADLIHDPNLLSGSVSAASVFELAQRLVEPFKIKVRLAADDAGLPVLSIQVGLGETVYEILETAARYGGFLLYEDEKGALVLDRVPKKPKDHSMASGFTVPGNVERIRAEQSVDQRHSEYVVVWSTIDQTRNLAGALGNQRTQPVVDKFITDFRPLIIVSEQQTPLYDVGLARANWEYARRLGRSQMAEIMCDSWRDSAGKLWTPNRFATIEAPAAGITGANWLIGSVNFRKDMDGTHAELVLMPPDAFNPEPKPLAMWDARLAGVVAQPQSPAPPSNEGPPTPGVH